MASGVNSTFRQVGIACGIAALGSIFATRSTTASEPAGRTPAGQLRTEIADAVTNGQINAVLEAPPRCGADRPGGHDSFVDALNHITFSAT